MDKAPKKNTKETTPQAAAHKVKKLVKKNKARMLSIAVAVAVGSSLTACTHNDDSYYRQGTYQTNSSSSSAGTAGHSSYGGGAHYYGSYYYGRGASYRSGSWGATGESIGHSTDNGGVVNGIGG